MVNIRALKAEMVKNDYNQKKLATALNITTRTLSNRFRTRIFGSDEIEKLIEILKIKDPMAIFFDNEVS